MTTTRSAHAAALLAATLFTCAFAIPVIAQECPNLANFMERPYEPAYSVAVADGYAYTTQHCDQHSGDGVFRVIDVRTPSEPVEAGTLEMCAGNVVVSGRHAYVNRGDPVYDGVMDVRVIDVSDPTSPSEVGVLSGVGRIATVSDGYAYTIEPDVGLWVIEITDPTSPIEVGFLETHQGYVLSDLEVSDHYAYVTSGNSTESGFLEVIDVSSPSAPFQVGIVQLGVVQGTECSFGHVEVSGNYAYLMYHCHFIYGPRGMIVVDVSDPSSPSVIANLVFSDSWGHVLHDRGCRTPSLRGVCIVNGGGHLDVYNVSDPSNPVKVASISEGYCRFGDDVFLTSFQALFDIDRRGRYVYAAGRGRPSGLRHLGLQTAHHASGA